MKSNREPLVVRLLIDQGSEMSFVSEDIARQSKLKRNAASIPLLGIGGTHAGRTKGMISLQLQSIHDATSKCFINAFVLSRLTTKLPQFDAQCPLWPHLNGLPLADPEFSRSGPIHIILGADNYSSIILPGLIQGKPSTPIAQQTIFGWILSGPISTPIRSETHAFHCVRDNELQDLLAKFWKQEDLTTSSPSTLGLEEAECERHFVSTHSRDSTGRYVVRLPLKANPSVLGDSRTTALGCLRRLSQRLSTDLVQRQRYSEFLQEYQSLGHMTPVSAPSVPAKHVYYLPHHGVLQEQSLTTKLRVVFNGSSKTSTGLALNDILHAGAKLQEDLSDILLRTRTPRFVFSTDMVKMFRQIAVHSNDQDLQRILWLNHQNEPVAYRLTTVTYGLNCAPFLALRTIQQLVKDEGHRFPRAIIPLTKGRYVDDIFGGADTISEAREIIRQLVQLCAAGGFPLQKWNSNCPELLTQESETHSIVEIEPTQQKILGLVWQPGPDSFHFSVKPHVSSNVTKRSIASDIAKLFDPLGLISPVLIPAKIMLQELWLLNLGWDEPLAPEIQQRWTTFRQQLQELNKLAIPRWLGFIRSEDVIEIHGFSDASQLAMAAAVYLRTHHKTGEFSVQLMCSKTRVAPIKRLTIPRLELTAALLLARLVDHTSKAVELSNAPIYLWTDSTVALTWITSHPSRWKDFVHNRVSAIKEILPTGSWRYVPGKENPTDCASRGLRPDQLICYDIWWRGPRWLSEPQSSWPQIIITPAPETDLEERPRPVMVAVALQPSYWNLLDNYSSLTKLLRVTAACRRVVACMRRVPQSSLHYPLTPMELEESRLFWARTVQQTWMSKDISMISRGELLPRSNPLVRLIPFIDRHGVLRVGGRLHNAQIDTDAKHPIILPRRSPFTTLIVDDAHRRTLHGGTQVTLGFIRRSYWVIGGRAPIRSFILRCVRCARYRGERAKQLMGQLPTPRVTPARPFLNSGLDYAGPISLKTWKGRAGRTYKGYLAIFICLATSAVHLEVVTDYTTEAFIAAYKRFTGRRGICATLQSDCGTNFVGADTALRQRFDSSSQELRDLAALLANDGTKWNFNPPSAPHFGGKWEAAVKSTKFHLARVLGDTVLTYEELTTIMVQIEAVLNSRPLCPLSDDASDYSALTPGHFLIGEAPTTIPEPNLAAIPISRLSRWQLVQQRVETFWTRWSAECLQRYLAISKWHHPSTEIKEGSLVLMTDDRYPPAKWPLARVLQLHPGTDGLTRVVTLRTANSTYSRPIAKVCIVPIDTSYGDSTTDSSKGGVCIGNDTTDVTDTSPGGGIE